MHIPREAGHLLPARLETRPVVALLGPRQVGKSSLARELLAGRAPNAVYLDLERPSDLRKLTDPEAFFAHHRGQLVCLDEIQRRPDIFAVMRSVIDETGAAGQFLVLGSASPQLLKQASETLAGRITFVELAPFSPLEVDPDALWLRGGFPRSYLARDDTESFDWRLDFIRTFLERDIPQLGLRLPAEVVRRLWQMCAHSQGQILNSSKLGASLGVSHTTARTYVDLLESTFLVRTLKPFIGNVKKRLVRSPKVYVRDSGILHALLELETFDQLLGHPIYGHSWEGLVVETVLARLGPRWRASFYRTSHGAEIDLVLTRGPVRIAIECKASRAPELTAGFWNAREDVQPRATFVVAPVNDRYALAERIWVVPLRDIAAHAFAGFPV